jgi:hypothetical protein
MAQDPFERVQVLLSETRVNPLALLLDLASVLPDSLVDRAISLAENANDSPLRAFVIYELAKRLPTRSDRIELTSRYFPPAGTTVEQVSVPEGKEAKRLIAKLTELQRFEVFDQLFVKLETGKSPRERFKRSRRPPETKSVEDDFGGGFESADPPENFGGGGATSFDKGFDAVDAGFESTGGAQSAGGAIDDGFEAVTPAPQPTPQPTSGASEETSKRPDLVNLGFSHKDAADRKVQKTEPLQCAQSYYFRFMIGKEADEAAIGTPREIDLSKVPAQAVLTVALFSFENEIVITPGQDVGEVKINENGSVKVQRQPVESIPLSANSPAGFLEDYLLFPIRLPDKEGTYRLRCSVYCGQVLVQSYVVSANVKRTSDPVYPEACGQQLDYVLSQSLRADHLASINKEPHLLSLMMNDNGNGKHGFRFFGNDGAERFKDDAQIDGQALSHFLYQARAALRRVSWGNEDEWDGKTGSYRYLKEDFDEKKLARDLAYLANAGYSIYYGFSQHLNEDPDALEALLANPGLIQIALKLSPRAVLPAAVVYDYAWNPQLFMPFDNTDFKLCPSFSKALKEARNGGPPLEDCVCFHGGCELKQRMIEKPGVNLGPFICPSGFWGYRHLLGLPLTLDGINTDIPPVIEYKDSLQMFACVSTDGDFVERDPHLKRLSKVEGLKFERDDAYDPFVNRLRSSDVPQVLYFYCHGGVKAGSSNPFLQVGMKEERKDEINPPNWRFQRIKWKGPNPLVFINGCHTTSLDPEVTLDFVTAFVQTSGAAGVIGTEITIFEPLAVKFAEECFKRFVGAPPFKEKMPIGKAVRGARLELLRQGNPLGLVYIPYAVASLRLEKKN